MSQAKAGLRPTIFYDKRRLTSVSRMLESEPRPWAYIGSDFNRARQLADNLSGLGEQIKLEPLNEIAVSLREQYIDYIGQMSEQFASLAWWESRISEKDPHGSTFFQNLCLLERCTRLIREYSNPVLIIDNYAIYRQVCRMAGQRPGLGPYGRHMVKSRAYRWLQLLPRRSFFIFDQIRKVMISKRRLRRYYRSNLTELRTQEISILQTWMDSRSFSVPDDYTDAYFGQVAEMAKGKGESIAIMPYVLQAIDYSLAITKIVDLKDRIFIVPHYFLSWTDIFRMMSANLFPGFRGNPPLFRGANVRGLLADDLLADRINNRCCHDRLYYYLPTRLKAWGLNIKRVIYPFENQTWEKDLLLGMGQAYPSATTVGYQHSSYSNLSLNYFIAACEQTIAPIPDKLLAVGEHTRKTLKQSFGCAVEIGGAVRYQYIFDIKPVSPAGQGDVVIATSIELEESAELLDKCIKALGGTDYCVILKSHPLLPSERLISFLGLSSLPDNFKISTEPLVDLLKKTSLLIYDTTTVALEALAFSIPALQVASNFKIMDDRLADFPGAAFRAATAAEVAEQVHKILKDPISIVDQKRGEWGRLINTFFTKPSTVTYSHFFADSDG